MLIGRYWITPETVIPLGYLDENLPVKNFILKKTGDILKPDKFLKSRPSPEEMRIARKRGATKADIMYLAEGGLPRGWATDHGWILADGNNFFVGEFDAKTSEILRNAKSYWNSQEINDKIILTINEVKTGHVFDVKLKEL